MAWNESGGGDKDPWGNRGNNNDGPPDLDEAIKKLQGQLSGMFGGGGGGGEKRGPGGRLSGSSISLLIFLALGLYAFAGVYQVDQQERGVIFRFGQVLTDEVGPGLHWNPPIIDQVDIVNVTQVQSHSHPAPLPSSAHSVVHICPSPCVHLPSSIPPLLWLCSTWGRQCPTGRRFLSS